MEGELADAAREFVRFLCEPEAYVNVDAISRRESDKEEAQANVATCFAADRFASAVIGRGHEHPEPDSAQGVWWTSNAGR